MNYYPFHIGDYAAHTGHLDPLEDVAYRRAIDAYMLAEGPLPADPADVARRIRMRDHVAIVESILREFFTLTAEGWRHSRCDAEIAKVQSKSDKARNSAAKRWHSESDANAMRTHSDGNAPKTQDPIPKDTHTARATPVELAVAMRKAGVDANSAHPEVLALSEQGVSVETVTAACQEAARLKPGERLPVAYIARMLESWAKRAAETRAHGAQAPPSRASPAASRTAAFMASLREPSANESAEVIDVRATVVPAVTRRLGS